MDLEIKSTSRIRNRRRALTTSLIVLGDFVSILTAGLLSAKIRFGDPFEASAIENVPTNISFASLSIGTAVLWVLMMATNGLYDRSRLASSPIEVGRVARTLSVGVVALTLATYILRTPGLSRGWLLLTWVTAVVLVLIFRSIVAVGLSSLRRRGILLDSTLIVGSNNESADLIRILRSNPESGLVPIGCLASSVAERLELDYCSSDIPMLGVARDLLSVVREYSVDSVVIASSAFDHEVLARMIAELRDCDVDVHISSGLFEVLTSRVLVNEIAGIPLITVKGVTLSPTSRFTKRAFDLVISCTVVLVGMPIWLLLSLLVKATSRGPVIYGQKRIGKDGTTFTMLKFRSMYQDAEERRAALIADNEATGPLFKMRDDPRVTPLGRWMRKSSLDEFPQLLNVVRGEMSLVGPRPPLPCEVENYTINDWRRLEVTPGMTGLWQISGRSALTFEEMVRLDIFYIENWSVSLDIALIMRTIPAVLAARGAY